MRECYQEIVKRRLDEIFDEGDAQTVLTWLISNEGRSPVVVVGAGFSLNARNKRSGQIASPDDVPLWSDVQRRCARDLGLEVTRYDALTLAELYREEMGQTKFTSTLLEMLGDEGLEPGDAHNALFDYPAAAVVTTNQLDTLLDENDRGWVRVVCDPDLALRRTDSGLDLIYFHGHRSNRASWVFTRSQYQDIHTTKPLIVTRVRQLLSQNPVLIVGFSLADPDFHQIYRQLSLDMQNHHPVGLALFPHGRAPEAPERRYWERLGIRIATFNGRNTPEGSFGGTGTVPWTSGYARTLSQSWSTCRMWARARTTRLTFCSRCGTHTGPCWTGDSVMPLVRISAHGMSLAHAATDSKNGSPSTEKQARSGHKRT